MIHAHLFMESTTSADAHGAKLRENSSMYMARSDTGDHRFTPHGSTICRCQNRHARRHAEIPCRIIVQRPTTAIRHIGYNHAPGIEGVFGRRGYVTNVAAGCV